MSSPAGNGQAETRHPLRWLRFLALAVIVSNAVVFALVTYPAIAASGAPPTFYLPFLLHAGLIGIPLLVTFWDRYWGLRAKPRRPAPEVAPKEAEPKEYKPKGVARVGILTKIAILLARPVPERTRVRVLAATAVFVLVLILFATFAYPSYSVRPGYDNIMVVIFIVGLVPPSLLDFVDRRYKKLIDARIPDFLREIGESQRTGTTFTKSLMNASQANYGPLSTELKKAMAKMSWGYTFEDALNAFADSANTALAHRAAVLLNEVGRSGGKMLEVLDSVYEHIREVINLQRERAKQLTPYVIVIYASFGVYLFVVYILFSTFFAQVSNLQHSGAPFGSNINPSVYYIWFYHLSVIECVFGGLVAGKVSAGSSVAGLKHLLILLLISYVTFTFFITY